MFSQTFNLFCAVFSTNSKNSFQRFFRRLSHSANKILKQRILIILAIIVLIFSFVQRSYHSTRMSKIGDAFIMQCHHQIVLFLNNVDVFK